MLPKRKRTNDKSIKIDDLINLINYQTQIIEKLSEKVNNLENQQKLLEEIWTSVIQDKLDKNNEEILDIKEIVTKSKLEIIKSVNKIDKKVITSIKNISSEISNLDKEVQLLLLNSVMEQL